MYYVRSLFRNEIASRGIGVLKGSIIPIYPSVLLSIQRLRVRFHGLCHVSFVCSTLLPVYYSLRPMATGHRWGMICYRVFDIVAAIYPNSLLPFQYNFPRSRFGTCCASHFLFILSNQYLSTNFSLTIFCFFKLDL